MPRPGPGARGGGSMGRRRRRARAGRALGLAGAALGIAGLGLGLVLAAWAWARSPPRELPEEMPGALELLVPPVGRSPQGWFLQHLDQEEAPRERRSVSRGKRPRSKPVAAHYKVQLPKDPAGINSGPDGTIRGWEETLNATKPLNYNPASGEFDVLRKGLYYLYCQVHFNEGRTVYIKLDVVVDGVLALRCLEQFPPTSAGPQDPELHVCQVSGLLLLQPHSVLRLRTIRDVRLKAEPYLTFFGLFQGPGELEPPLAAGGQAPMVWRRGKRGSEGKSRQQDQRHQHRKRSVLHLAPSHRSTNNEGDMTEIWWQPFLQQGPALEVSGPDVAVKQTGLYLVYSQVLFHDPTFTMGQVLWRASAGGPGQILLRCVQSMPREPEQAYNSCYSGGVFQLQRGDQLSLRVPRANASLDLSPHGTFLGLVRL